MIGEDMVDAGEEVLAILSEHYDGDVPSPTSEVILTDPCRHIFVDEDGYSELGSQHAA